MTERDSRHGPVAQLLIAWSPLTFVLLAYALAGWISAPLEAGASGTNRLGFALHVTDPAEADRALLGRVPSVTLQAQVLDGSAHWWDGLAALVYVTHFLSIPLVTGIVWFRLRDRFKAWLAAVMTFTAVGITGYVVYPAAPPWLASDRGAIGAVHRISNRGWEWLHLDLVGRLTGLGQDTGNPVAAMPSLHAGAALLVTLFLWPALSLAWRTVLTAYVLAMAVVLVYTGEHYVVDVVAGWLVAVLGVVVPRTVAAWWPARSRRALRVGGVLAEDRR